MSKQTNKKGSHFSQENLKDVTAEIKEASDETAKTENNIDYAMPYSRDRKKKSSKAVSAKDDLDDYIFQTPVKTRRGGKSSRHKKRRFKRWQKAVISILLVLVILAVGVISGLFVLSNMGRGKLLDENTGAVIEVPDSAESEDDGKIITYKGKKYKFNEDVTNVLCMGIDKESLEENDESYGTNGDADVLFLVSIDTKSGEVNTVSISRDTMAEIDAYSAEGNYAGTKNQQICLAYAYGNGRETSCENQVAAVKRMFYNIPISSYFAIDLSAISALNDAVGGVTVTPAETFKDFTEGNTVTLYGSMAESYVRYRDTSQLDSNSKRMERQKQYLQSFFSRFVSQTKQNIMTPLDLYSAASPYMVTNIDASRVTYFAGSILQKNFSELNMQTVPGEFKKGEVYAEYHIDEDKFFEMFLDIYYTPIEET